jgi:hypothetical protein
MYYSINNGSYEAQLGDLNAELKRIAEHVNYNNPNEFYISNIELVDNKGEYHNLGKKAVEQANDFIDQFIINERD